MLNLEGTSNSTTNMIKKVVVQNKYLIIIDTLASEPGPMHESTSI
jgi:hypothetical protein